jgi:hypothetical protein
MWTEEDFYRVQQEASPICCRRGWLIGRLIWHRKKKKKVLKYILHYRIAYREREKKIERDRVGLGGLGLTQGELALAWAGPI